MFEAFKKKFAQFKEQKIAQFKATLDNWRERLNIKPKSSIGNPVEIVTRDLGSVDTYVSRPQAKKGKKDSELPVQQNSMENAFERLAKAFRSNSPLDAYDIKMINGDLEQSKRDKRGKESVGMPEAGEIEMCLDALKKWSKDKKLKLVSPSSGVKVQDVHYTANFLLEVPDKSRRR